MPGARDILLASSSPILHVPTYQYANNHLSNTLTPRCLPPHHFSLFLPFSSDHLDSILLTLSPLHILSLTTYTKPKVKIGKNQYFRNFMVILVHLQLTSQMNRKVAIPYDNDKAFLLVPEIIQGAEPPA